MNQSFPSQAGAERSHPEPASCPHPKPHVLLADPDLDRAQRIAVGLEELGWVCEIAPGIWEALGLLDSPRFTHLVAQLRQMGPDDLGGMLLAWTWLRTARRPPLVLGTAPEIVDDPSVAARRILLAPESACPTEIWSRFGEER